MAGREEVGGGYTWKVSCCPSPGAWPSPWAMGSCHWHFGNLLDQSIKIRSLFQSYPISVLPRWDDQELATSAVTAQVD